MNVAAARAVRIAGESVTHRYGPRVALAAVDFEANAPGVVAVTGPNGAGKSTLLRILAGLLRPTGGRTRLEVDGAELRGAGRRHDVGLASPELAFYEEFTASENLEFAARTRGMRDVASPVQDALSLVGLGARARDRVAGFSSGMKQRLRLAFAVLHHPALLLLDEPGSHLDDAGRAVMERLVHAHAAHGLVLLATNDPKEMTLAGRRIELHGRALGDPS